MKKTFKVVMLPTNEKANIGTDNWYLPNSKTLIINNLKSHLYIISDDEIKEGDWYYSAETGQIYSQRTHHNTVSCHKIVATTDKFLEPKCDGKCATNECVCLLPQLPESFIQAYIKAYNEGKPITEIDLEMTTIPNPNWTGNGDSTILGYTIKTRPDNTVIVHQSKMYTRDEVKKLLNEAYLAGLNDDSNEFMANKDK